MTFFFIAFFFIAFIFSILINGLFLRLSMTLGIRDKKETVIRWASSSKPALGGISFFIVFLISLASYSIFFETQEVLLNKKVLGLLCTVTLAFMMGLADDAYNTRPFLKLFVQILCGLILCYSGVFIGIFPNMMLNYLLTIIWVVGIMNSLNMLDNMDAISTIVSISIFSSALMLLAIAGYQNNIHFLILIGTIASLSGFLLFNWHPSKLFMGDTGSQILGLLLSVIGIVYFWNDSTSFNDTISISRQILMVAVAFVLPIADTTIVIINRLLKQSSPFIGGKDHTTHHLFYRGLTEKRIAILFALIGMASACLIYFIETKIPSWSLDDFLLISIFPVGIFASLFIITLMKGNIIQQTPSLNQSPAECLDNENINHAKKYSI
ncbi:MAG: undecaprenyl/decaprenyl-phosphate alpha-N-acetylglucosaminyl 1-phosphate transferase [Bacteroidetes bacterium]|nr:undecaprenyl/decaprenyl-phosphate alpha-N-acetylglucosaminyl 1-phosphate transferase [Bacteroidota bacterium]